VQDEDYIETTTPSPLYSSNITLNNCDIFDKLGGTRKTSTKGTAVRITMNTTARTQLPSTAGEAAEAETS
jgi:hypothetical protein